MKMKKQKEEEKEVRFWRRRSWKNPIGRLHALTNGKHWLEKKWMIGTSRVWQCICYCRINARRERRRREGTKIETGRRLTIQFQDLWVAIHIIPERTLAQAHNIAVHFMYILLIHSLRKKGKHRISQHPEWIIHFHSFTDMTHPIKNRLTQDHPKFLESIIDL